jgi:hypothetical protein
MMTLRDTEAYRAVLDEPPPADDPDTCDHGRHYDDACADCGREAA